MRNNNCNDKEAVRSFIFFTFAINKNQQFKLYGGETLNFVETLLPRYVDIF